MSVIFAIWQMGLVNNLYTKNARYSYRWLEMNTAEAAEKWNCSKDDVAAWCRQGYIPSASKPAFTWVVPDDAKRPIDRRLQREIIWRILENNDSALEQIDMTIWGITADDFYGYLSAMMPLFIKDSRSENCEAISSTSELAVTEAGFRLIGRYGAAQSLVTPKVLIWAADAAGIFAGSFVRQMVMGEIGSISDTALCALTQNS